jgi:hypothetical protein
MTENLPVKPGELSKVATVLIEKVSDAVGGLFKPHQVKRMARAAAEANRIRAESEIEITDIQRRAMYRFIEEEGKKQENMETITKSALSLLKEDAGPQSMSDDWIANFFEKSRIISDGEMQQLWSRLLAGEANTPGTFARSTVNLLSNLDKYDAELFMKLCGFCWRVPDMVPLVFDFRGEIYTSNGIDFLALTHLETLGLVRFSNLTGFQRIGLPKRFPVSYHGVPVVLSLPAESDNSLEIGQVLFTRAGQQIAQVCGSTPVKGFFEYVCGRWAGQSFLERRQV